MALTFATHDIVSDSPTNNFCTWNKLAGRYKNSSNPFLQPTFSEGNTKVVAHSSEVTHAIGTIASTGKHYAEFIVSGGTSTITGVGVISSEWDKSNLQSYIYNFEGALYAAVGTLYSNTTTDTSPIAITTSFRVGIEVDFGANEVAFFKVESNGTRTQQGSTITTNIDFKGSGSFAASLHNSNDYIEAYFIEDDWWGTPNSGYTALCTANLPDFTPTVTGDVPQDYFKTVLYTGNGGNDQLVDCGFPADFIWIKGRTAPFNTSNLLYDTLRGRTSVIQSQNNAAELDYTTHASGDLAPTFSTASNSINGFKTPPVANNNINHSGSTYVTWFFRAGGPPSGSTSTTGSAKRINTSGTQDDTSCSALATAATNAGASNVITPTLMSINQAAGFSIIKYTGPESSHNPSARYTIPHGLNSEPEFVITKSTNNAHNWHAYHKDLGGPAYIQLNLANPYNPSDPATYNGPHDQNVVKIGGTQVMAVGEYIMYCWHSVEGYSAFGSYEGSTALPFVYTGFRPSLLILKNADDSTSWVIHDSARDVYNEVENVLVADAYSNETTYSTTGVDFLSNGFKLRGDSSWYGNNLSTTQTVIFMAFAEQPFKYANAR